MICGTFGNIHLLIDFIAPDADFSMTGFVPALSRVVRIAVLRFCK
jgi:hypothetical protein